MTPEDDAGDFARDVPLLSKAGIRELSTLQRRAYGRPGGPPLEPHEAARLAALELVHLARADLIAGVAAEPRREDASGGETSKLWWRRLTVGAAGAIGLAVAFGIGAAVGHSAPPAVVALYPSSAADSFARTSSAAVWDAGSLRYVGTIDENVVWTGTTNEGRQVCAAFDSSHAISLAKQSASVETLCNPIRSSDDYPSSVVKQRDTSTGSVSITVLMTRGGQAFLSYISVYSARNR